MVCNKKVIGNLEIQKTYQLIHSEELMEFSREQLINLVALCNCGDYPSTLHTSYSPVAAHLESKSSQFFQVLIVDVDGDGNRTTKLVYGEKGTLTERYRGITNLPSKGVLVDDEFVSPTTIGKYSTVRFLLQCRKLSQMMVYTWIDETNIQEARKKLEVKLIREIFHSYNIIPDTYFLDEQEPNFISSKKLAIKILQADDDDVSYLIKPQSIGYSSIRLDMLLCGQAYYKTPDMEQYRKIGASIAGLENGIFSTYEMIWEYAMNVSWDTFIATRIDISQSGRTPNPPYTQVTLGYPPRPEANKFNVTSEQMKNWAFADDSGEDFPFYPKRSSAAWQNKQLQYIIPPYPYLPLSCS